MDRQFSRRREPSANALTFALVAQRAFTAMAPKKSKATTEKKDTKKSSEDAAQRIRSACATLNNYSDEDDFANNLGGVAPPPFCSD